MTNSGNCTPWFGRVKAGEKEFRCPQDNYEIAVGVYAAVDRVFLNQSLSAKSHC